MAIERIAVVGGGTMGSGIAQVCALHGRAVTLVDLDEGRLDRALTGIERSLGRVVKKGAIEEAEVPAVLGRIGTSTEIESCRGAQLAIEAVSEDMGIKRRVFAELERATSDDAVLATNTSSISITAIAGATHRADKVVGMHFMNPVPVMKLVEIVRGLDTSDATCVAVTALAVELGKTPVEANDSPGFVSNRILMPMINEAVFALMEGVATREAIDEIMTLGMAHPMGPLALADLIGLDVCLDIMEVLHRDIGDGKYRPCPLLRKMVAAGHLGRKTGRGFYTHG